MEQLKKVFASKEYQKFAMAEKNGRLSHAYLVFGEDDKSNKMFCKALTLKLVCESGGPCFSCAGCKKIEAGFHPDVLVYPKGKSFLVADSEDILANASIKPMESRYKIFLINNFDLASVQSQNKLLKTIEEAPKNVVFIINAVNQSAVLQTIKSRTQIIEIGSFNNVALEEEQDFEFLLSMLENMQSSKHTLLYAVKFAEKTGFLDRLKLLAEMFEEMLYCRAGKENQRFFKVSQGYKVPAIAEIIECITLAKRQFEANVSTNLITDNLLLKILEVRYKWNK